jgi:carbon starvation protein CstA
VTKFVLVVLMFIIALGAIYGFAAMISLGITKQLVTVTSEVLGEVKWSAAFLTTGIHVLGDPIRDPIPNHR